MSLNLNDFEIVTPTRVTNQVRPLTRVGFTYRQIINRASMRPEDKKRYIMEIADSIIDGIKGRTANLPAIIRSTTYTANNGVVINAKRQREMARSIILRQVNRYIKTNYTGDLTISLYNLYGNYLDYLNGRYHPIVKYKIEPPELPPRPRPKLPSRPRLPTFGEIINNVVVMSRETMKDRHVVHIGLIQPETFPRTPEEWAIYRQQIYQIDDNGYHLMIQGSNNQGDEITYAFNRRTIDRNTDANELATSEEVSDPATQSTGRGEGLLFNTRTPFSFYLVRRRQRREGAFLNGYVLKEDVTEEIENKFARYQVYKYNKAIEKLETDYKENCLIHSIGLAYPEMNKEYILNKIAPYINNGNVETRYIGAIARDLELQIELYVLDKNNRRRMKLKGITGKKIKIGYYDNHYFIVEPILVKWEEWGFPRRKTINIADSFNIMTHISECDYVRATTDQEKSFLNFNVKEEKIHLFNGSMVRDDMEISEYMEGFRSIAKDDIIKGDNINGYITECNGDLPSKPVKYPMRLRASVLDIETYRDEKKEGIMKPVKDYSTSGFKYPRLCTQFTDEKEKSIEKAINFIIKLYDIDTRKYMKDNSVRLKSLYNNSNDWEKKFRYEHPPVIYAHNVCFDTSVIRNTKSFKGIKEMVGTNSCIKMLRVKWEYNGYNRVIEFRDSHAIIPIPLSQFGEAFSLDISKAKYPYNFYNQEFCERMILEKWSNAWVKLDDFFGEDCVYEKEEIKKMSNIIYNPINQSVNAREYCKYYNELDVRVLWDGLLKFWSLVEECTGIDVSEKLTIGSIAQEIVIRKNGYKHIHPLKGKLSEYIRKNLRGGMVLLRNNEHQIVVGAMMDLDINSLYPFCQLFGIPAGIPFLVNDINDIHKIPAYIATFKIIRIPEERPISYIPYKQPETGSYKYLQKFPDGITSINLIGTKQTYELLTKYQGLIAGRDFYMTSVIGFPAIDMTLSKITRQLYEQRQIAKRERKTALTEVLKLLLNNIWGKTAQRTFNEEMRSFTDEGDAMEYMKNNIDKMMYLRKSLNDNGEYVFIIKNIRKRDVDYTSRSQVAISVLEHAKITLAKHHDTLKDVGIKVLYSDTDSVFITDYNSDKIQQYRDLFRYRYGNDPMELGANNSDIIGNMKSDYKVPKNLVPENEIIESKEGDYGIFIAPKIYMNRVRVKTDKNIYHYPVLRAKGITQSALAEKIKEDRYRADNECQSYINLYTHLATKDKNEKVLFNMLAGDKISIKYNNEGAYYRSEFVRNL